MRLFVVSDLHIRGPQDPIYRSLLTLLRDRARESDTVVLAGDIFDLFVGKKNVFLERYTEAYRRELAAFVEAVRSGTRPSPDGRDGLAAQRLADAATESRKTGRPVAIGAA